MACCTSAMLRASAKYRAGPPIFSVEKGASAMFSSRSIAEFHLTQQRALPIPACTCERYISSLTEALLTGRFECTSAGRNLRIKLGVGHALVQNFGAAQWRIVFGVEMFGQK